jgi:hypothetical protein
MLDEGSRPEAKQFVNMALRHLIACVKEIGQFELDPTLIRRPIIRIAPRMTRWWWGVWREVIAVLVTGCA